MEKIRLIIGVLLLSLGLALAGCWDSVELEERGMVTSLGIDKYSYTRARAEAGDDAIIPEDISRNRYTVTFSLPSADFIKEDLGKANIIYSTVGESLYNTSRLLTTRINSQVYFGHLSTIVLGETIVQDEHLFREILDVIERDALISRRVNLVISACPAQDVLKVESNLTPVTGDFIKMLFQNKERSSRSGIADMGSILKELHNSGNTVIPRITARESDLNIAGSAVIKNYQLEGWLGEIETRAIEIMKGRTKTVGYSVHYGEEDVEDTGAYAHDFHVVSINSIFVPRKFDLVQDSPMELVIRVGVRGKIEQFYLDPHQDLLDRKIINRVEEKLARRITEELEAVIDKLQKEYRVDVIGLGDYINKYHHDLWQNIEEDWTNIFPSIVIKVDTDVKIRRIGMIR